VETTYIGKVSKVQGIYYEVIDKKPSLIEDKVMISVTNIYFCDIKGFGKQIFNLMVLKRHTICGNQT